jgi:anti-sigma regulatory factor (Ser/Thr protein kinase)
MTDREAGARREFPRSLAAVSDLLDWSERFFEAARIPTDHRFGVQLGLEELFTNLVKYGAGSHPIEIELVRRDSVLLASLTDQDVEPFDPTAAPDADTTLPLDRGSREAWDSTWCAGSWTAWTTPTRTGAAGRRS